MSSTAKRFRIAFTFAEENRDFISKVAAILAEQFGEEKILYDKYHEAEFARRHLGFYLPELYRHQSDLIVVILCPNYDRGQWTGLEWSAIHDLLSHGQNEIVLLCRFEYATVQGIYSDTGFIELDGRTPEETATLILERLAINEKKPRHFYLIPGKGEPSAKQRLDQGATSAGKYPESPSENSKSPFPRKSSGK